MKKNKLAALLLVLSLCVCMFAGCGNAAASAASEAASEAASAASEAEAAEEAPAAEEAAEAPAEEPAASAAEETASAEDAMIAEAEEAEEDGISKYVTPDNIEDLIAGRPSVELPIAEEGTSVEFWTGSPSQDATITTWNDSTAAVELEKRTGVHVDYIEVAPPSQSESLNLMFASGDYPEILNYAITGTYSAAYMIDNDIAVDLADYLAEDAPSYSALMEADPALYLATVNDEGQIGGLAGYSYNTYTTTGALVRGDWLDAVGMKAEDLTTIDAYHDYLTAVSSEGLCEYPMPIRYDASISGSPFLAALGGYSGAATDNSASNFYYNDDDELVYSFTTDEYKEYITMMAEWYQEGLITRDLLNSDRLDSNDIASGKYAVIWQDCQFLDSWVEAGQVDTPDFSLVGVEEPKQTEDQVIGHADIASISINLIVTTACQDVDTAVKWLDYHFSEEGSILCQYGLEGEGLVYDDNGKPNYSELISDNPDGLSTDNALNAYAININMYAKDFSTLRAAYTETQQEALNAWNDKRVVTKSSFMSQFTLNTEETDTVQKYYTDISTYASEEIGKFLVGELDIDAEWDTFVETVESMGIDEVIEAYAAAGERYFGRL